MKQQSLGLSHSTKRTRRREFLGDMERVVPWIELVALVAPFMPEGRRGRPPFTVEAMLRIHFMQQWFNLSDPAMEDALHDVPLFRDFAGLGGGDDRLRDESIILRFRHVLEKHKLAEQILKTVNELLTVKGLMLKSGTVVDATLIAAPSSTKNNSGERDPEMKQNKKGQHQGEGRAPVPGDQAPVRAREGALPRAGEEHGAVAHAVRVGHSVAGQAPADGSHGMSTSAVHQSGGYAAEVARSRWPRCDRGSFPTPWRSARFGLGRIARSISISADHP